MDVDEMRKRWHEERPLAVLTCRARGFLLVVAEDGVDAELEVGSRRPCAGGRR